MQPSPWSPIIQTLMLQFGTELTHTPHVVYTGLALYAGLRMYIAHCTYPSQSVMCVTCGAHPVWSRTCTTDSRCPPWLLQDREWGSQTSWSGHHMQHVTWTSPPQILSTMQFQTSWSKHHVHWFWYVGQEQVHGPSLACGASHMSFICLKDHPCITYLQGQMSLTRLI